MTYREKRNPERVAGEPSQTNPEMTYREKRNPERVAGEPSRRIRERAKRGGNSAPGLTLFAAPMYASRVVTPSVFISPMTC